MLRIFFSPEDVARTRLARAPNPLWETVLSLQMLRGQPGDLLFSNWRRDTIDLLRSRNLLRQCRLLMQFVPQLGYFPDFLTPAEASRGLAHGFEAIHATPKKMLSRDMLLLADSRRFPPTGAGIAAGDLDVLTELTDSLQAYYDVAIEPVRGELEDAVSLDLLNRMNLLAEGGLEALFAGFSPDMTWERGELRVPSHRSQEIHLDGRGLLLMPAYFCVVRPMTMFDPALPPVLVYPVEHRPGRIRHANGSGHDRDKRQGLAGVMGQTRASMLERVGPDGRTTGELAHMLGISAASVSEHASVMRAARLIVSYRDRNRVIHRLSQLGLSLLAAQ